jgi:hypothetical protein
MQINALVTCKAPTAAQPDDILFTTLISNERTLGVVIPHIKCAQNSQGCMAVTCL